MHVVSNEPSVAKRPLIRITADIHNAISEAADAIGDHDDVFQRDGRLVQVIRAPEVEVFVSAGSPIVRVIPAPTLREMISEVSAFERIDARSKKWARCAPTEAIVAGVLHRGNWPHVRRLIGVLEAPSMRPDGSLIQERGYDKATGYLYEPSIEFPAIDDAPSQDDARNALAIINDLFADFPFIDESARSVPAALFLTIVARPAIAGCTPAFMVDANTRGSGKTLVGDAVAMAATGRLTAKMSYPSDDIELEKVLAAYAIRASALVNFDNVTRPFGGGPLDRCLTAADTVELRVLGRSEIQTLQWRSVIIGSGNNVTLTGDTARRLTMCRLESPLENPENRTGFRHSNLVEHVRTQHAKLVVAALTILRAWFAAGCPRMNCPQWGSFDAWAAMVPPALVFAGGADPMMSRPSVQGDEDPEKAALVGILAHWQRIAGVEGVSVKTALDRLYPLRRDLSPPDGLDELREAIEILAPPATPGKPPTAAKVGNQFRRFKRRVVGGRMLDAKTGHGGSLQWRVVSARTGDTGDTGDAVSSLRAEDPKDNSGKRG